MYYNIIRIWVADRGNYRIQKFDKNIYH
ncbi:MAG: hypothetical protein ACXWEW_07215 [Nitrososphaeraceae archaeon]